MVANSDARSLSFRSDSYSSTTTTTTTVRPEIVEPVTIPLRVPTPEDTARYDALLAQAACLSDFVKSHNELESYKTGAPIALTGSHLTLPAVYAVSRYPSLVASSLSAALTALAADDDKLAYLDKSRKVIDDKLAQNKSIYGVSTGFGGSADTRTGEHGALGLALLQHQHAGILPSSLEALADSNASLSSSSPSLSPSSTPLPLHTTTPSSLPPAITRAALLIRLNSLLRGHSAASPALLNAMGRMLEKGVTPVVPLRGSISASGDLSPLSYVAGALVGERGIFCWTPAVQKNLTDPTEVMVEGRILRAPEALKAAGLEPISLRPKEQLAILNGTAFSCGVAALCVEEARELVLLGTACTALGTEAMRGSADSFCAFIQAIRPHPGQIETGALLTHLLASSKLATRHAEEVNIKTGDVKMDVVVEVEEETIDADAGTLRQDRYPLRTAPQWLGPQLETVQRAAEVVEIECNSTTDNPLIDPETGIVHHGGNFQAMALTSALEPLRLSLFHIGKLLFAQSTELLNSSMNNGLAGNLAASDPSLNFCGKGIDIAMAAYVAELAFLANPVSTGVQSAEMHNQAVNSLALVAGRYTLQAIEVLQLVTASYLYLLCQAVDLRALQGRMERETGEVVERLVKEYFGVEVDAKKVGEAVWSAFDTSANMDALPRTEKAARASTQPLVDALLSSPSALSSLPSFQRALAASLLTAYNALTASFLTSTSSPGAADYMPALPLLGRTGVLYRFVRETLGVRMHGRENLGLFEGGLGNAGWDQKEGEERRGRTIGGEVSVIYEAVRDGRMKSVLVGMFGAA